MIFWVDAMLAPALAPWLAQRFSVEARAVRDLGLRDADDAVSFEAARAAGVVVITKDKDLVELVTRRGAPPQVLWVTCGNTSNARLRSIFEAAMPTAIALLERGEPLIEISDAG